MNHTDIINRLVGRYGYASYLEIGLDSGCNFREVTCPDKESVDPFLDNGSGGNGDAVSYVGEELPEDVKECLTYRKTSDEFFAVIPESKRYDIIFIDGLHTEEQVGRDIINGLKHLNEGGVIVIHDCLPPREECQRVPRECEEWNGDVWKAVAQLSSLGIPFDVVDTDYGCGIVRYVDRPELLGYMDRSPLSYLDVFSDTVRRDDVMYVITEDSFTEKYIN